MFCPTKYPPMRLLGKPCSTSQAPPSGAHWPLRGLFRFCTTVAKTPCVHAEPDPRIFFCLWTPEPMARSHPTPSPEGHGLAQKSPCRCCSINTSRAANMGTPTYPPRLLGPTPIPQCEHLNCGLNRCTTFIVIFVNKNIPPWASGQRHPKTQAPPQFAPCHPLAHLGSTTHLIGQIQCTPAIQTPTIIQRAPTLNGATHAVQKKSVPIHLQQSCPGYKAQPLTQSLIRLQLVALVWV